MKYYLSYGSNLDMSTMSKRCPSAEPFSTAVINHCHLVFRGSHDSAYLTIEQHPEKSVQAGIWKIGMDGSDDDENALDVYEGYPHFYFKHYFDIEVDGQTEKVMCYLMNRDCNGQPFPINIPSVLYFVTCYVGFCNFGFDTEPLFEALRESGADDEVVELYWQYCKYTMIAGDNDESSDDW